MTPATFEAHVGSVFRARPDEGGDGEEDPLELMLTEVTRLPIQPHAPRPEPFSLVFTAPAGARVEQRTYALAHTQLGGLDLFLVPLRPGDDGRPRLEAVFN